jgi:hypothetical protein
MKQHFMYRNGTAPRMPDRRTRMGFACYKSDAETMTEAVEHLENKMKEFKSEVSEATKKEIKTLTETAAAEKKALSDKVAELNIKVAEKDGTIEDIQNEVKELKARGGRFRSASGAFEGLRHTIANEIARGLGERKAEIANSMGGELMKPYEIKTVANIASANLTVDNFISYLDWRPGMEPTGQFHFRNLVRTVLSETDFIQFPRANTPIGEGSFGRQTEAATKAQVDRDYTMVALTLKPMAAFAVASRQSLRNILFLQSWLPESMMNQMEESEDTDFANTLVAAATGSSSTTGFTGTPNVADKLVYYIKNLIAAKYNPNGLAVDPNVWANLILLRPGTAGENYSGPPVVSVDQNGTTRVLGRPIYPVNWLTGNRVLIGDWSKAAIVQSEGLRLRQSDSHASLFTSNEICFLIERTEGLAIFRPDAFITTTI